MSKVVKLLEEVSTKLDEIKELIGYGICEDCGKKINPKYVRCWACNEKREGK